MSHRKSATAIRNVVFGSLLWSAAAHGQWTLTWDAPVGCPRREQVLAAVRDIVGETMFQSTSLEADGRIQEVDGGYRLELRIAKDDGPRVRSLDAKTCHDLLGASAVVLGLHVKRLAAQTESVVDPTAGNATDPAVTGAPSAAPPSVPAATAPKPEPQTKPDNDPDVELPETDRQRHWWLALPQGGVVIGSLPQPAWFGSAALGWRGDPWRIWVAGRYQLPQSFTGNVVPNVGVMVDKYSAELGVSHGWSSELVEIALGVVGGVDYVVARGTGEDIASARAGREFAFVGVGLTFRWLMTDWLSLAAGAVGEMPIPRPYFDVESLGAIGQVSPVHLRTTLGLEWNF